MSKSFRLVVIDEVFAKLDIDISRKILLDSYFKKVEEKILWRQVFSNYKLEFNKNKSFFTHINSIKMPLEDSTLCDDGSIIINNERIYSLR